MRMAKIVLNA